MVYVSLNFLAAANYQISMHQKLIIKYHVVNKLTALGLSLWDTSIWFALPLYGCLKPSIGFWADWIKQENGNFSYLLNVVFPWLKKMSLCLLYICIGIKWWFFVVWSPKIWIPVPISIPHTSFFFSKSHRVFIRVYICCLKKFKFNHVKFQKTETHFQLIASAVHRDGVPFSISCKTSENLFCFLSILKCKAHI